MQGWDVENIAIWLNLAVSRILQTHHTELDPKTWIPHTEYQKCLRVLIFITLQFVPYLLKWNSVGRKYVYFSFKISEKEN